MPGAMQEPPARNSSTIGVGMYSHSGEFMRLSTDLISPGRGLYNFSFARGYRSSRAIDKTVSADGRGLVPVRCPANSFVLIIGFSSGRGRRGADRYLISSCGWLRRFRCSRPGGSAGDEVTKSSRYARARARPDPGEAVPQRRRAHRAPQPDPHDSRSDRVASAPSAFPRSTGALAPAQIPSSG
jgi:hypothetical protein